MYGTPGGEIPSVGKVELVWVQTPLPSATVPAKTVNPTQNENSEDSTMDEGDAMISSSSPGQGGGHGQEQQDSIDYDVADDNDWGPQ